LSNAMWFERIQGVQERWVNEAMNECGTVTVAVAGVDVSDRGRGGKSDERDAATIFDASTNEANGREDENGVELCGWD